MKKVKMNKMAMVLIFFAILCGQSSAWAAGSLTLEKYKSLVQASDPRTQGAELESAGAEKVMAVPGMITVLQLKAGASFLDDGRPTLSPATQGTGNLNRTYNIGVEQQTELGLKWGLTQYVSHTSIVGIPSAIAPEPEFYDTYPRIDLTLPLWRNFFGAETSARIEQLKSQAEAQKQQAEARRIQRAAEVAMAYFNLLAQQELVSIQKDNLSRSQKIFNYADSRVRRNLTDRSDLYQAQAAMNLRQIELQNTEKNLQDAARKFNLYRGIDSDHVAETLIPEPFVLSQLDLSPEPVQLRIDAEAQQNLMSSQEKSYRVSKEENKPQLNLNVSHALYGRDKDFSTAQRLTYEQQKDYWLFGLTFSMPIDQITQKNIRTGYDELARSQSLHRAGLEQDHAANWRSTVSTGQLLKNQIGILRELESVQNKKADLERSKLNQGRSTTFQVINFEQDFVNVRSQRVSLELQIRQFITQLALYRK